jgi:hypothetical protein
MISFLLFIVFFLQIEEVKNKETYSVAKALLEKYGETITPEIRSPVVNGNSIRQRTSIKPAVSGMKCFLRISIVNEWF